jgi:hypothetical protein
MKKWILLFLSGITIILYCSCNDNGSKDTGSNTTTPATAANKANDGNTATGDIEDSRINNAGGAKRPKGKMSYVVNGTPVAIDENMVQCMYIGMNSTMAQSVISGGSQCTIVHMGIPTAGNVEIESIATMPSVGIQVFVDGVQYNNKKAGDAKFALTKVTPDGKNYYVAGTFSGKLTSIDGTKTITVTDGFFESAYL